VVIFLITFLGGFVIGLAGPMEPSRKAIALAVSNIIFGSIGFAISGSLVKVNRFHHLGVVAIGVWLVSLINVIAFGLSFANWALSIVIILIMMGLGGAISFLFSPAQPKAS
jgi:hypothetical protein